MNSSVGWPGNAKAAPEVVVQHLSCPRRCTSGHNVFSIILSVLDTGKMSGSGQDSYQAWCHSLSHLLSMLRELWPRMTILLQCLLARPLGSLVLHFLLYKHKIQVFNNGFRFLNGALSLMLQELFRGRAGTSSLNLGPLLLLLWLGQQPQYGLA